MVAAQLQDKNIFWPHDKNGEPMQAKGIAAFAISLHQDVVHDQYGAIETMDEFFSTNRALNRSIVISSEELDSASQGGVVKLHSMLQGYDVTIVYVYRELLSHLISLHFELNRLEHDIRYSQPFSTYLMKNLDNLPKIVDPEKVLLLYEKTFGKKAISVIDLIGCGASGHDISYVLVCEIAGVLCDREDIFQKKSDIHSNAGYTLINSEIFSCYYHFIQMYSAGKGYSRKCGFCQHTRDAWRSFESYLLEQQRQGKLPKIPIIHTHLSMLVPYAEEVDKKIREMYGDRILHGNSTANKQAMRDKVYTEFVDGVALMDSTEWMEWMITAYREDLKQGRLCGCSPATN